MRYALIAAVALMSAGAAWGEGLPRGKVITRVACKSNSSYSYAAYLPKKYSATRKWPVLYCFSPGANGPSFVKLYRRACERHGWIVVASNNSRNGVLQEAAIAAMYRDTRARLSCHPERIYATGFSGGSRVATWFAGQYKGIGNIAIGGVYLGYDPLPKIPYYLTCGEKDMARKEMDIAIGKQKAAGVPVVLKRFRGGHQLPPSSVIDAAVKWIDGHWKKKEPKPVPEKKDPPVKTEPAPKASGAEKLYDWGRAELTKALRTKDVAKVRSVLKQLEPRKRTMALLRPLWSAERVVRLITSSERFGPIARAVAAGKRADAGKLIDALAKKDLSFLDRAELESMRTARDLFAPKK